MLNQDTTMLQRAKETLGKEVSLDTFLFSCWEHEKLVKKKSANLKDPICWEWPHLAELGPEQAETCELQLEKLCEWLKQQTSELTFAEIIDISKITHFVPIAVSLAYNIEGMTAQLYPVTPAFDSRKTPTHEFWQACLQQLQKHFPQQQQLLEGYLWWTFGPTPIDDVLPGSRPPVGRFAFFGKPRSATSGGDRGPRLRNNQRDGGSKGPRREGAPPRRDGSQPRRDGEGRRGGRETSRQLPKDVEAGLRKEILLAIAKLRESPATASVALAPQNSFHRRWQHQMISEEGFASVSTGEGDTRAVMVVRPADQPS